MGTYISCEAATIMAQYKVPWYIIAQMVNDDYTTAKELAGRWLDLAEARTNSPTDLKFSGDFYDKNKLNLYALRVANAVEHAKASKQTTLADELNTQHPTERAIQNKDRTTLLANVQKQHSIPKQDMPKRNEQGSDHYVGLQYLEISKGHLGDFPLTKMLPWKTDHRPSSKRHKTEKDKDGYTRETQEEYQPEPDHLEKWQSTLTIFRWTLLMCLSAFPEMTHLQITKKELDDYYEFIMGDLVLKRTNNKPSLKTVMITERRAWSMAVDLMYEKADEGITLPKALEEVRKNSMWWTNQLDYKPPNNQPTIPATYQTAGAKGSTKSKNTPKGTRYQPYPQSKGYHSQKGGKGAWTAKGKSKQTKGKGKGYNQPNQGGYHNYPPPSAPQGTTYDRPPPCPNPIKCNPSQMASTQPDNNKPFCKNYHLRSCPGGCGRSHNCPYLDSSNNNTLCNARPGICSHRFQ